MEDVHVLRALAVLKLTHDGGYNCQYGEYGGSDGRAAPAVLGAHLGPLLLGPGLAAAVTTLAYTPRC